MFTFSFSSAMAETTYTASEVLSQLTAEKTEQVKFLNNTKATLLQALKVDEDGFEKTTYWTKTAYEKAADTVIKAATKAMDAAIRAAVDEVETLGGTVTYVNRTVVSEALVYDLYEDGGTEGDYDEDYDYNVKDLLSADRMKECIQGVDADAFKAGAKQAKEDVKTFVEGKLTADLTKYNAEDKVDEYLDDNGEKLTAADYVQKLIDDAKDAMDEITKKTSTEMSDAEKAVAYAEVYYGNGSDKDGFKKDLEAVPTLEDEKVTDAETAKDIAGAASAWLDAAIEFYNDKANDGDDAAKFAEKDNLDTIKGDGSAKALLLANEDIYEAKAGEKTAKLFGVDIANRVKMTKAEAIAVNNAMYDAMVKAADALKAAAKTPDEITALISDAKIVETLAKSMLVAEKIADVEKAGEKMKGTYSYGLKTYDDEAVTKAVEAAKKLVYKALLTSGTPLKEDAKQYIFDAAEEEDIDLYVKNFEKQKFLKAIQDAIEKMYKDGQPTVKVSYGEDKTAEADLVYLKGTYAASEAEDWEDIAEDTIDALIEAQTYAEIDEIMADAAKEFGKLMLKKDASDVEDAQKKYLDALTGYYWEVYNLKGDKKDDYEAQLDGAGLFAQNLILSAKTVDGVKAAYEEAKKILDNVKTDDEMDDAADAIKAKINALPFESQLTLADKDAVVEAYNAYMEYLQVPGAEPQTEETVLKKALEKILTLEKEAYEKEIKDMKKALDALAYSDADRAEYLKLKADVAALVEKVTAHNDFIEDVEEGKTFKYYDDNAAKVVEVVLGDIALDNEAIAIDELEANLYKAETDEDRTFWEEEITAVSVALVAAGQDGATVEQMKAALEAYKGLTDRQKYNLDASVLPRVKVIEQKLATAVKGLKLTASSKATKGAITVKWTVKGDKTAADGYQIWKSTKMNSGYKKAFTTTKMSYKNSKGLKKGVKYYYKVRAYKVVDGKNVYSDWSNKAYRVAK